MSTCCWMNFYNDYRFSAFPGKCWRPNAHWPSMSSKGSTNESSLLLQWLSQLKGNFGEILSNFSFMPTSLLIYLTILDKSVFTKGNNFRALSPVMKYLTNFIGQDLLLPLSSIQIAIYRVALLIFFPRPWFDILDMNQRELMRASI